MATRRRSLFSVQRALVAKSKEAALTAVQAFNNPLVTFKSETYIVLMVVAWTYLLHAYYRGHGVEYRYIKKRGRRRTFDRTESGAYRYWELTRCLKARECPLDPSTQANLRFLIGLRNEIEHHLPPALDDYLGSRYLACALNYEFWLTKLFGDRHSLNSAVAVALQFGDLSRAPSTRVPEAALPATVARFMRTFDEGLADNEYNSERFAYRLLFVRKAVGKRGQADRVIEFIPPDSDLAKTIEREHWALKEVERPKFRPTDVVERVRAAGFPGFGLQRHIEIWKRLDGKDAALGYGVQIAGVWYWYARWIDRVLEECQSMDPLYR